MNTPPLFLALPSTLGCEDLTASRVQSRAQTDACRYVRVMHPNWLRPTVLCQGVDTDGNGYVRCTVGDGGNRTEVIECRTSLVTDAQRGCVPVWLVSEGAIR